MSNHHDIKLRYNDMDLQEFRQVIETKLAAAQQELNYLKAQMKELNEGDNRNKFADFEDGTQTAEIEYLNQMAKRQLAFINNLGHALVRIRNKTYGVCRKTGKLIDRKRLLLVPHTTLSMEAKTKR